MNPELIHAPAVAAAAASYFVIGGLWYSPVLFGKAWMRENGFDNAQVSGFARGRIFGGSAVLAAVMSLNLACFLADAGTTFAWGLAAGALAGFGWVAAAIGVLGLFENRSFRYVAINAGYQAVAFTIMGGILGAWR